MDYLKAFLVGGAICMLGQLLIDKTRLTPARILVCYDGAGTSILGSVSGVIMTSSWTLRARARPSR